MFEGILKHTAFSDNPELSKEAAGIFIWCLSQNTECYKQWVSIFCLEAYLFEFMQVIDFSFG